MVIVETSWPLLGDTAKKRADNLRSKQSAIDKHLLWGRRLRHPGPLYQYLYTHISPPKRNSSLFLFIYRTNRGVNHSGVPIVGKHRTKRGGVIRGGQQGQGQMTKEARTFTSALRPRWLLTTHQQARPRQARQGEQVAGRCWARVPEPRGHASKALPPSGPTAE